MKRPSKLHLKSIQALDLDQIVANLERTVLETEKKVERIISRGPTPRNLKTNYQKNVPEANGRRIEDIRKTLRGARRSLHVLLRRQRGLMKGSAVGEKASPSKEVNIKIIPKKAKTYATASVQTEETSLVTASTQTQTIKEPAKAPRKHGMEGKQHSQAAAGTPVSPEVDGPSTARDKFSTPPTKKMAAKTWKTKALLKIRKALYKKIVRDSPTVDAVFLDEYEKVNRTLEQLGIRRKSLPPDARGRPRLTEDSNGGTVSVPEPHAVPSNEKVVKRDGAKGKSFEYLFAKILAGPLSPAATDSAPASVAGSDGHLEGTTAPSHRGGEVQDIDEDIHHDAGHIVDISESFSVELSDRSVTTPPRTPNRTGARRIVKTPPSSGRKRNRNRVLYPLSRSPKPKRIFNPVSPILKAKGETNTLLFNSIEF